MQAAKALFFQHSLLQQRCAVVQSIRQAYHCVLGLPMCQLSTRTAQKAEYMLGKPMSHWYSSSLHSSIHLSPAAGVMQGGQPAVPPVPPPSWVLPAADSRSGGADRLSDL